jgi:hypothetical protein
MARLQIARSAETDLLEGYVFYERQQAGVGDYFLDSLCADIDALALYAGIHPKPDSGSSEQSESGRNQFGKLHPDLPFPLSARLAGRSARGYPAFTNSPLEIVAAPHEPARRDEVRAHVADRQPQFVSDLLNQSRFTHLARAVHNLYLVGVPFNCKCLQTKESHLEFIASRSSPLNADHIRLATCTFQTLHVPGESWR